MILDYRSDVDYILELRPTTSAERIILAKLTPATTLTETVNAVVSADEERDAGGATKFGNHDYSGDQWTNCKGKKGVVFP